MPVPVPRFSKQPSHPVTKNKQCPPQAADLHSLSTSLPPCPTGLPPSFGTREDWINPLPAWRTDKSRRIWEDEQHSADSLSEQGFPLGLTAAGNAPVIKGAHAEACLPPLYSLFDHLTPSECAMDEEGDDMGSDYSMDHCHLDNQSQWTASSTPREIDDFDIANSSQQHNGQVHNGHISHEHGAFSPVYDDRSPEDPVSSPLGPVTPFGVFVDRAVTGAQIYPSCDKVYSMEAAAQTAAFEESKEDVHQGFAPFALNTFGDHPKEPAPAVDNATTAINAGYKRLAEPLANWIADYVWKVCTTGLSLPPPFITHP